MRRSGAPSPVGPILFETAVDAVEVVLSVDYREVIFLPIRVRPLPLFLSLVDVELSLSAAAAPSAVAVVPYNQKPFEHLQRKEATAKEEEEAIVATTRITCAPEPRTDLNACFAPSQSNRHLLPFLLTQPLRLSFPFNFEPSTSTLYESQSHSHPDSRSS